MESFGIMLGFGFIAFILGYLLFKFNSYIRSRK